MEIHILPRRVKNEERRIFSKPAARNLPGLPIVKGEAGLTDIILCGDPAEQSVTQALLTALSLYGGVHFFSGEKISEGGAASDFLLGEYPYVPRIELSRGILLLKNSLRPQREPVSLPEGFCCVLESRNRNAAELLQGTGAVVVSCGMGAKDTLSVAGLESTGAALSLQRNLVTQGGSVLEPHDFNVAFSEPRTPYQALLVSAVLLLAGVDSQNGYIV